MENPMKNPWNSLQMSSRQILKPFYYSSKTHCGVLVKDLIQELQSSIIQSRFDKKTKWALEEIFAMRKLEGSNSKEYKGTMSYIINKLKIACITEISPRCVENIVEIESLIDNYHSWYNLSKLVSLLTFTVKSRVCTHLQYVACDRRSNTFQEYYTKIPYLSDKNDVEKISKYILASFEYKESDQITHLKLRRTSAYLAGQIYRRKLGLDPQADFINIKKEKQLNKSDKVKAFKYLWTRLLSIANLVGGENQIVTQSIAFKRKIFEERNFDEEFLCILSSIESLFALMRKLTIRIHCSDHSLYDNSNLHWIENHKNEMGIINNVDNVDNYNVDVFWTSKEWELKFREIMLNKGNDAMAIKRKCQSINSNKRHKPNYIKDYFLPSSISRLKNELQNISSLPTKAKTKTTSTSTLATTSTAVAAKEEEVAAAKEEEEEEE